MSEPIPLHCYYRNRKTEGVYFAFGMAENQTNDQAGDVMILYSSTEDAPRKIFARSVTEFLAKFDRMPDGAM